MGLKNIFLKKKIYLIQRNECWTVLAQVKFYLEAAHNIDWLIRHTP